MYLYGERKRTGGGKKENKQGKRTQRGDVKKG
jgi:hypothetical protein